MEIGGFFPYEPTLETETNCTKSLARRLALST